MRRSRQALRLPAAADEGNRRPEVGP